MSSDKAEIIRAMYRAFNTQDRELAETLLAGSFTFTSPYDDGIDRNAFFERCWPNSKVIKSHILERIFVEGDAAFVTYLAQTDDGREFRNTEFFTFDNGLIGGVEVYFGPSYKNGEFQPEKPG